MDTQIFFEFYWQNFPGGPVEKSLFELEEGLEYIVFTLELLSLNEDRETTLEKIQERYRLGLIGCKTVLSIAETLQNTLPWNVFN